MTPIKADTPEQDHNELYFKVTRGNMSMSRTVEICGTILLAALFASGCAKKPESIAPAYVSPMTYKDYTCDQLAEENGRVEQALAQASAQQRQARSDDTLGVIFLGLPVSSLSGGNVADQVARLKGEHQTLQQAMNKKDCSRVPGEAAASNEPAETTAADYTPLPERVAPPYEGTKLSTYSVADMQWFCRQSWERRVSPTTGRTEFNPCHRPEKFSK